MNKPITHNGDLRHLPAALDPLTQQPRWVLWSWEYAATRKGAQKWTKPPYQVCAPERKAKSNDPTTWGRHGDAVDAVAAGKADGIGYMLFGADVGAGDLDHCRDPETGKIESWAEKIVGEAGGAYIEATVSGSGLRVIGKAEGAPAHRKFSFDRSNGAALEIYRNTPRYITVSGAEIGTCTALPPIDGLLDTLLARFGNNSAGGLDFNDAGPQPPRGGLDYDDVIKNGAPEGQRSELFNSVVWHLAAKGWTADQITDELALYPNGISRKYADRLHGEVTRCYEKRRSHKRAAATGTPTNDPWPQIYLIDGELPRTVNEAETALLSLSGIDIYRRGILVRPVLADLKAAGERETSAWRLIPVNQAWLIDKFTCAAQFLRWDGRARRYVPTDCPDEIARTYLCGREGNYRAPVLSAITNVPFLRRNGSICETPGYDAASGVLFKTDQTFPPIPQSPTRAEAIAALDLLKQIISAFPFVTQADHVVALAAILTALDRRGMDVAPLFAFTAPAAGTGKSLLIDIIAVIVTGRLMPVIAQGRTEEELEKRLGAALLAGDAMISIDNCDHTLESSFLCQALTQRQVSIRILGLSKQPETPTNATFFANGNNLVISGDLTRRTLLCSMDAQCERPQLRRFDIDAIAHARGNRERLVAAALTVLRAWHSSGETVDLMPFGSFEEWSRRIREALVWLECPDPCETMMKVKEDDPRRTELCTVLAQWREHLGTDASYKVQEIIGRAVNIADFHSALVNVAGNQSGQLINSRRLGRWLKRTEGKIVASTSLKMMGVVDGYPQWQLIIISK